MDTKQEELNNLRTRELEAVRNFANQFSLNRVKTEGIFFDRDYRRNPDTGQLELTKEKAVVVTHGKVTKVPFGEDAKYQTYEEAVAATKKHWSEYFKRRRQMAKSDAFRQGQRRRQKAYRERLKTKQEQLKRQQ